MQIRTEVNWFAEKMEKELQANDHKGGWRNCYIRDMLIRIPEEYTELVEAVASGDIERIVSEAADVANFALMVADLAYRYGVPNTARGLTLHEAVKPIQDGVWFCPRCANTNPNDWQACVCCDLPRPS